MAIIASVTEGIYLAKQAQVGGLSLVHSREHGQPGAGKRFAPPTSFDREELGLLLNLYGRKVSAGEWLDYAMDFLKDQAMFSVYRRTSERPIYIIEKNPKLARKQGQYLVTNQAGRILKRGHNLAQVLRVLDAEFALVR